MDHWPEEYDKVNRLDEHVDTASLIAPAWHSATATSATRFGEGITDAPSATRTISGADHPLDQRIPTRAVR